jgi:hypothetical protein
MKYNYLTEYIKEMQLKYPNSAIHTIKQFLYTIDNGVEFIDGVPHVSGFLYRNISLKNYYQEITDIQEKKDIWFDLYYETETAELFKLYKGMIGKNNHTGESIWNMVCQIVSTRYEAFNLNFTWNDLLNPDFLKQELYQSKYVPSEIHIQNYLTENSDPLLIKLSISVSTAYINIMQDYLDDPIIFDCKKKSFDGTREMHFSLYEENIQTLQKDIIRLNSYLS